VVTHPITESLTDSIGLLVAVYQNNESEEAKLAARERLARNLKLFEEAAFKRGYDARQTELIGNLQQVSRAWQRSSL
jgi:hypothetical protein